MERLFDSDDSVNDPTYNPDPDSLIQPEDLFGDPCASSTSKDDEFINIVRRSPEEEENVVVANEVVDVRTIVLSIWDDILKKVFESKRSRKRWTKQQPENWKVNVAKKRRADGLPYVMGKKERDAKVPKQINCENCKFKCNAITEEERQVLCRHYWNLNFAEQKNFLLNNIKVDHPKRVLAIRGPKKQRRFTKRCFFFHDGEKTPVCQNFFCKTLAIGPSVINNAIEKRNESGLFQSDDKRGKHEPPNKTKEADVDFVKKHIESFPCMEPHYIRKTSKRRYLDASLSITKMHRLYKEKCVKENIKPVSEITYRRIFCNDYNYSFFVPKKDQCLTCSNYTKGTNDEKFAMQNEYDDHLARKTTCNAEKTKDKERSNREEGFCCITFDLQAVLQIPSGLVGQLYYCRKLCVYNLCIYEAALPNDAYCFTWSEVNGKRGSSEIGSILYHYLSKNVPSHVTEVCLYSDTCGGQNRNQYVTALLLYAVKNIPHLQKIEHKFLESGHSYMEVDSMHSSIESAKKNTEVYSMPDYISIFKRARSEKTVTVDGKSFKKQPFQTKEFKYHEFYDLKTLAQETISNRTKDNEGNQVKWLKIKRMRYLKEEPTKIFFNYDMSENFLWMEVSQNNDSTHSLKTRAKKRKDNNSSQVGSNSLKQLYMSPIPISEAKKKDLIGLCNKKIIPEELHGWFSSLPTNNEPDRLPEPAADEESSEE